MKRIWNNIRNFFKNLKKLYRLAKVISFEGDTVLFEGSIETTKDVMAGEMSYNYCNNRFRKKD